MPSVPGIMSSRLTVRGKRDCFSRSNLTLLVEAGRRLVALGFDPAYLPEGVHRVRCPDINAPLTDEEQQFAAKKRLTVRGKRDCFSRSNLTLFFIAFFAIVEDFCARAFEWFEDNVNITMIEDDTEEQTASLHELTLFFIAFFAIVEKLKQ